MYFDVLSKNQFIIYKFLFFIKRINKNIFIYYEYI